MSLAAAEIGMDCQREVLCDVLITRLLAGFETAILVDRWQSESSGSFREYKSGD